MFLPDNHSIN